MPRDSTQKSTTVKNRGIITLLRCYSNDVPRKFLDSTYLNPLPSNGISWRLSVNVLPDRFGRGLRWRIAKDHGCRQGSGNTQLRGERADWREDSEYETENARQELSTRAARVQAAIPTVRSRSRAEGLPLCTFRKSMGRQVKNTVVSDPRHSSISRVGPLSRPATSAKINGKSATRQGTRETFNKH